MKTIMVAFLLTSTLSLAATTQVYCSNGEGTVNLSYGSEKNLLQVTSRNPDGDVKVFLNRYSYNIRESTPTKLEYTVRNTCQKGDEFGVVFSTDIYAIEVLIANNDGSRFPENIVGLQQDGENIRTFLICDQQQMAKITCSQ
jgi:hypothetical protein